MRKFVYSSVTLEHHAEDPIYLKGDQSLAFLFFFFTFLLFSELILDSKE